MSDQIKRERMTELEQLRHYARESVAAVERLSSELDEQTKRAERAEGIAARWNELYRAEVNRTMALEAELAGRETSRLRAEIADALSIIEDFEGPRAVLAAILEARLRAVLEKKR